MRKDGRECGAWINRKKTEFCDFHVNLQVEKARARRMEVNGMGRFGGGGGSDSEDYPSRGPRSKIGPRRDKGGGGGGGASGVKPVGGRFDFESRSRFYAVPGNAGARSAAAMLDDEIVGRNAFDRGMSKEERDRKHRAERQKERDLARQLGELGTSAGGEYMRLKDAAGRGDAAGGGGGAAAAARNAGHEKADAAALGLLGKSATDVTLSPVKRKRGTGGGTSEPVGWGGAFKRGLLLSPKKAETQPKSAQELRDDSSLSPSKKRARFLLDNKGLREPGRESLGVVGRAQADDDDDDDDDLDIIGMK